MRIALTGTPGTGKSTVAALLPFKVIDLNALVKEGLNLGLDPERECLEADMDGLEEMLSRLDTEEPTILEGHLSHYFADEAIVLRLSPQVLRHRLEERRYTENKIRENLEAEALDVILVEAVELCSRVSEIDATHKTSREVADLVVKAIRGEIELRPGKVDWLESFFDR